MYPRNEGWWQHRPSLILAPPDMCSDDIFLACVCNQGKTDSMSAASPTSLTYSRSSRILTVCYDDGEILTLSAQRLRVESPSAEVQGHGGPSTRQVVMGKEQVQIVHMEPIGSYAVRLVFDDGHDTGLYTWSYLRELSRQD
jgi:DUF971 family protein